jgi:hypothetical protein
VFGHREADAAVKAILSQSGAYSLRDRIEIEKKLVGRPQVITPAPVKKVFDGHQFPAAIGGLRYMLDPALFYAVSQAEL